jgi:hypothetical protein
MLAWRYHPSEPRFSRAPVAPDNDDLEFGRRASENPRRRAPGAVDGHPPASAARSPSLSKPSIFGLKSPLQISRFLHAQTRGIF